MNSFWLSVICVLACACGKRSSLTENERERTNHIGAIKRVAYAYEENFLSQGKPLPPNFQIEGRGFCDGIHPNGFNVAFSNPSEPPQIVSYNHFYYSPKGEMKDAVGNPIYLAITLPGDSNTLITAGPIFQKLDKKRGKNRPSMVRMNVGWEEHYKEYCVGTNLKPEP